MSMLFFMINWLVTTEFVTTEYWPICKACVTLTNIQLSEMDFLQISSVLSGKWNLQSYFHFRTQVSVSNSWKIVLNVTVHCFVVLNRLKFSMWSSIFDLNVIFHLSGCRRTVESRERETVEDMWSYPLKTNIICSDASSPGSNPVTVTGTESDRDGLSSDLKCAKR